VKAKLFTDGGSRGNPGPAAYAFVLEAEDGTVLDARGETIGVATNNVAEYAALVAGLERAAEVGVSELEVISDSELLVKQMRGEYRGKNKALITALEQARELGAKRVKVLGDSELIVKQMRGEYRVKNETLQDLHDEATRIARRVGRVEYTNVRRAENEVADRLVNEALDAA